MKKYHILIDDLRNLNMDIICRTSQAGFRTVVAFSGDIECLYMDHDLGEESQTDGYELLKKLYANDGINISMPDKVQLVTSNPVGRQNMADLLISNGYIESPNGINFKREQHGKI